MLALALLSLAYHVSLPVDAQECIQSFAAGEIDCTTAVLPCLLVSSDGKISLIGPQQANTRSRYRTCFNGAFCQATAVDGLQDVLISTVNGPTVSSLGDFSTLQIISSPNFGAAQPNYLGSAISRFNIDCGKGKQLQYSFQAHHLEQSANCGNSATCIDFVRLDFPTYNENQVTCGTLNNVKPLVGIDGMAGLNVEFVTNRLEERPGVRLFVYCRDPAFDANFAAADINSPGKRRRKNVEDCTSPNGLGPRDEPLDPPPAKRIQDVMDRDKFALSGMLEVGENLTYISNTVMLSNGTTYPDINCLTIENRIRTKTLSGSSTGSYGGFAQLVVSISEQKAVLVQFGARPIFQPTEEEAIFIGMLESGISEVLSFDEDLFLDLEDEIGDFPRFNIQSQVNPSKRNIESSNPFLDELAMEFGNACNGALRSAACHYQDLVLERSCLSEDQSQPQ